jgi:DUF4097 and DUF4098 domain-containing protein YvlB
MNKHSTQWLAIATAILAFLPNGNRLIAQETEQFEKTAPLSEGGRVSVSNINGPISIASWDRAEVKVEAVKSAATTEALGDATIEFEAQAGQVEIKTRYAETRQDRGNSAKVEYRILVPRKARLAKVENVNGAITIENVDGEVQASTINGTLTAKQVGGGGKYKTVNGIMKVAAAKLGTDAGLSLDTVNGKVELVLPANLDASVKADTLNGKIQTDFDLTVEKKMPIGRTMQGDLGKGGPSIKLHSVNGALSVNKAAPGAMAEKEN